MLVTQLIQNPFVSTVIYDPGHRLPWEIPLLGKLLVPFPSKIKGSEENLLIGYSWSPFCEIFRAIKELS